MFPQKKGSLLLLVCCDPSQLSISGPTSLGIMIRPKSEAKLGSIFEGIVPFHSSSHPIPALMIFPAGDKMQAAGQRSHSRTRDLSKVPDQTPHFRNGLPNPRHFKYILKLSSRASSISLDYRVLSPSLGEETTKSMGRLPMDFRKNSPRTELSGKRQV